MWVPSKSHLAAIMAACLTQNNPLNLFLPFKKVIRVIKLQGQNFVSTFVSEFVSDILYFVLLLDCVCFHTKGAIFSPSIKLAPVAPKMEFKNQ